MSEDRQDFPLLHVYTQTTARSPLKIAANTTGLRALIDTAVAAVVEKEAKTELFCNDAEAYELLIVRDGRDRARDDWQLPYPPEESIEEISKVRVSPKLLEKASRLFNATLTDIFNELLQNSRRSGASRVEISLVELGSVTWVELIDDGCGIFKDGVGVILGESGWDEATREREDPAGMGIFSLAHRGATLESNGCRASLTEAQFCGRESYAIEKSDRQLGTKISFPAIAAEVGQVAAVVKKCSCYYPLPVILNGREVERQEFLANSIDRHSWRGLRIGVTQSCAGDRINFYGLVVGQRLPTVREVRGYKKYEVRIEVADAPELKLVLPARKEVVENDFFEEVKIACYRAIYSCVATVDSHALGFQHYRRANTWGINLPPASAQLELYEPQQADGNREWRTEQFVTPENAIIVAADLDAPEAQIFWRGVERADLPYTFYHAEPEFAGYHWYDAILQLIEISLWVEVDGKRHNVVAEAQSEHPARRSDRIVVDCTIASPDGTRKQLELETDVAFWRDERCYSYELDGVTIMLAKNSSIEAWELADLLELAYFTPSENLEADSYDTQLENFQAEALQLAYQLLCSKDEALVERLRSEVERHLRWLLPSDRTVQISIDRSINIQLGGVAETKTTSARSLPT